MSHRYLQTLTLLGALLSVTGCASFTYYAQSVGGQLDVIARRQPISRLLRAPTTPPALKAQLSDVQAIRQFAVQALHLPNNASYRGYTDIERHYVVWNVVATPAFSLTPYQWCFPIVGCVSYRGYFRERRAAEFAAPLRLRGDDVAVIGVPAYSTLGWFSDPVLSTIITWPKTRLAGLIFHELTHQVLYIKGDTAFNESFAVTVEEEGVRRWLEQRQDAAALARYREDRRRQEQFMQLVMATRAELERLYAKDMNVEERLAAKARAFAELRERYQRLKSEWGGYAGYDRWFAQDLNNAHLAALDTYREYVPAFRALLAQQQGDLTAFYAAARALGKLPAAQRQARLVELAGAHAQ
jgi:predicted aminopeptidase